MTIRAENLSWKAGKTIIVDDVSLAAEPGKMLGLLGPNGSGKSSLLRLLAGLRRAHGGQVTLDGMDLGRIGRRTLARRVALVEQHANTDANVTVLDVVRLGRTPHRSALSPWTMADDTAVETALGRVGLTERRGQFWQTLSGGERQRVHIARALAQAPTEIILDEPTNHLDIQHQIEILKLVAGLPVTSIVALHDLNHAAMFCDRLAVMNKGKLVALGTPEEVLTQDLLREVFGIRCHIETSPHSGKLHIHYLF
ncbi:ABC transporter (Iron.B12.siderophore.hemin), ATP-binding component [Devosia sp. LC5]|uniref:ABC transporter ATP-binding protein n=1 Tax=Devosia sp. LC5 TaxID=1502724 RepID=UPI0004E4602D|nr:ABC transporter ATP-binding protein [Devosia sp. LC5]KFC71274.1 ABC transporter (Iron.B12.siderophore.hemin), ATP-binding component [Devosia sp. LC5]